MAQFLDNFLEQDKENIAPLYGKADVEFVKGEGSYLFDSKGNKFLDFVAGIAVNALGYQNAGIKQAVIEQLNHFNHISNLIGISYNYFISQILWKIIKFIKHFCSCS